MNVNELIYEMAKTWLWFGGDTVGFDMNQSKIRDKIHELELLEKYGDD